jgi:hypothetical protein
MIECCRNIEAVLVNGYARMNQIGVTHLMVEALVAQVEDE